MDWVIGTGSMPSPGSGTCEAAHGAELSQVIWVGPPCQICWKSFIPSACTALLSRSRPGRQRSLLRSSMPGELQWICATSAKDSATPPRALATRNSIISSLTCWPAPSPVPWAVRTTRLRSSTGPIRNGLSTCW